MLLRAVIPTLVGTFLIAWNILIPNNLHCRNAKITCIDIPKQ